MIKVQTKIDLPHHSLVIECTTYCGTHYKMLYRILEQEKSLVQLVGVDPTTIHSKLRWQDTKIMESVVSALKSISDSTDIHLYCQKNGFTASCLKPLLNHVHNEALAKKVGDTTLKSDIPKRIKTHESKITVIMNLS